MNANIQWYKVYKIIDRKKSFTVKFKVEESSQFSLYVLIKPKLIKSQICHLFKSDDVTITNWWYLFELNSFIFPKHSKVNGEIFYKKFNP